MLYDLATATVAICAAGLIVRTLPPHVIFDPALTEKDRIGYPLTYWNALGLAAPGSRGPLACSGPEPCRS